MKSKNLLSYGLIGAGILYWLSKQSTYGGEEFVDPPIRTGGIINPGNSGVVNTGVKPVRGGVRPGGSTGTSWPGGTGHLLEQNDGPGGLYGIQREACGCCNNDYPGNITIDC